MNTLYLRAVGFTGLVLLQACGGGGGGGGGGSNGGGGGPTGSISVASGDLTFVANGPSGSTPAPQTIVGTVNGVSSGTLYILVTGTGSAIANISSVTLTSQSTGQASVSVPSPNSLGVGTHTGTITVRACLNDPNCSGTNLQGSPATINVTYHVAALQPSSTSLNYTIDNTPDAADSSRQITITAVPAQNWIATTGANWLSVTATGASGGTMNASLVPNVVEGMTNGTYQNAISLQHSTVAGLTLNIPVTLTIQRTQVNHVSPYVAYAGAASDVIIRGDEFSQVTIQNVSFGSTPAQSFTIVSPTEIRATAPASLPLGRHRVQLQSDVADTRQFAELVVVNAPQLSATALQYPDTNSKLVNALHYDAERAALGVSVWYPFTGATALIRFASVGNTWQPATAKALTNNFGLALSADGTEWIAGTDKSVMHIDADDLATVATVVSPLFPSGTQYIAEMSVANDGTVAMFGDVSFNCGASLLLYDVRRRTFVNTTPSYTACRGNIGASADGSRVLLAHESPELSGDDVLSLDASARTTTATGIHLLTAIPPQLNRTGSRIVLQNTRVYDGSYVLLGSLPATTVAVVISPDGSRAYAFEEPAQLRTYDLTVALPSASSEFPQLGAPITLPQSPGVPTTPPLYNGYPVVMTIAPDGRTVFIAGGDYVVVQPVP